MFGAMRRLLLNAAGRVPTPVRRLAYRVKPLQNLASRLLRSADGAAVPVTVRGGPLAGLRLSVDATTPKYYLYDPHHERELFEALAEVVRPGMTAVDCGAHHGVVSLWLARRVGTGGRVHSFEPDPTSRAKLEENVRLNGLENVTVHAAAVSSSAGRLKFIAQASATSHLGDGPGAVEVDVVTLDEAVGRADVVKLDVEGNEAAVLRGSSRLVAEARPTWLIETHGEDEAADCRKILETAKYEVGELGQASAGRGWLIGWPD